LTKAPAPLVYLHGLPGSPDELTLAGRDEQAFFAPHVKDGALLPLLTARFGEQPVNLVAFSLGAFRALRFAADHPERVSALHLIAPAAPLELGNFLDGMAGGPIFRLARDQRSLFRFVTRLQSLAARLAPDMFARQIFSTAKGADKMLAADPGFRAIWSNIARSALKDGRAAYCAEIESYVRPWAALLSKIEMPVSLYYGLADTWVPAEAVTALAAALPRPPHLIPFPNHGHYSTLAKALPMILKDVHLPARR
jgi:pimeloyl-ACP methyl ester carboxylesterase